MRAADVLQVSDNSGAKLVQCIQKSGTQWTIGDIITVAVKKARGTKVRCNMKAAGGLSLAEAGLPGPSKPAAAHVSDSVGERCTEWEVRARHCRWPLGLCKRR